MRNRKLSRFRRVSYFPWLSFPAPLSSLLEVRDRTLYYVIQNGGVTDQSFLKMLKEDKSKSEILKDTGCTVGVKNANISINEGEFFVIMGLSGSGKSTLLRCINRLILTNDKQVESSLGSATLHDSMATL